jgi:carboxymethylenebutenolidase
MIALLLVCFAVACSSSKKQQKSDTMNDSEYTEAMGKEHADDTPEPSPATEGKTPTGGEAVEYGTVDGKPVTGYVAMPQGEGPHPGVILIHEWWGLNDNIRTMADKLAGEGYIALAVDMYGGESADTPDQAKALMQAAMKNPEAGVDNLKQARAFLASKGATKIGVVGWCFGGGWSLTAGVTQGDDLDAVVMYYGRPKTTKEELAGLTAPLLGHFGAEDQGIPVEGVKKMQKALEAAGKDATIHVYEGVGHAFANPSGQNYSKEAAEKAWERTLAFFKARIM